MEKERDILRRLIERLSLEYRDSGWQIDYIDLRWGVSQEASRDNMTMRICLHELDLCREMSPRPNFIVLLGDRYGWRPLPEVLSAEAMARAIEQATPEEIDLINRWYILDQNSLLFPYGACVLQSRAECRLSDEEFVRFVEQPLQALFNRVLPETARSATHQEIVRGLDLENIDEIHDNAVAYLRSFAEMPDRLNHIYSDSSTRNLNELKQLVERSLPAGSVYREDSLSAADYDSPEFASRFEDEMESRLRAIIEREIKALDLTDLEYEAFEQSEFVRKESALFYGREAELREIDAYISSAGKTQPLIIKGNPGQGKSALMAKVAATYAAKPDYCVIPVFCNLTKSVTTLRGTLEYIRAWVEREFDPRHSSLIGSGTLEMPYYLRYLSTRKRYLIIIDGINLPDTTDSDDFTYKTWLVKKDFPLPENVRVIVTTSFDSRFSRFPVELPTMTLGPITDEALGIVIKRMESTGRCLQLEQAETLKGMLDKCVYKDGIYLSLLASELCGMNSKDRLLGIPEGNYRLSASILDRIASPTGHGRRFVRMVMAFIATASDGIEVSTLQTLLAQDFGVQTELMQRSFHLWVQDDVKSIPPILWTRLFYQLENVMLTGKVTAVGYTIRIQQGSIRWFILNRWLTPEEKSDARRIAADWYESNLFSGNRMAVRDYVYQLASLSGCEGADATGSFVDYLADNGFDPDLHAAEASRLAARMQAVLSNPRFITLKETYFPGAILRDFDSAIRLCSSEKSTLKYLDFFTAARNFIGFISKDEQNRRRPLGSHVYTMSLEQLESKIDMLWDSHPLKQNARIGNRDKLLTDLLRNIDTEMMTLYVMPETGLKPKISADGSRIYQILPMEDNLWKLQSTDIATSNVTEIFRYENLVDYAVSHDASTIACHHGDAITVMSSDQRIGSRTYNTPGAKWMSMSADGHFIAFGAAGQKATRIDLLNNKISTWAPAAEGLLSPSGNILWALEIECKKDEAGNESWSYIIYRCDYTSLKCDTIRISLSREPYTFNGRYAMACNENCMIIESIKTFIIRSQGDRLRCDDTWRQAPVCHVAFFPGSDSFALFYGSGSYFIYDFIGDSKFIRNGGFSHPVKSITPDMRYAFSTDGNRVLDFSRLSKTFVFNNDGNVAGLNSLTASSWGDVIVTSIGKNISWETGEIQLPTVTSLVGNEWSEKPLPGVTADFCFFVSASAISPDGRRIAYATYTYKRPARLNVYDCENRKIISSTKIPERVSSVLFTADSRWIIVVTGDDIVDVETWIFIFDHNGEELFRHNTGDYSIDRMSSANVSPTGEWLAIGCGMKDLQVWDLIERKCVYNAGVTDSDSTAKKIFNEMRSDESRRALFELSRFKRYVFDPSSGLLVTDTPPDCYLLGMSASGRYAFIQNKESRLAVYDKDNDCIVSCLDDVTDVEPTFDDRYFYASFNDCTVALHHISGKRVAFAAMQYSRRPIFMRNTAKGLVVGRFDGHASLFTPPDPGIFNLEYYAPPMVRADLRACRLYDAPERVCPRCGRIMPETALFCFNCLTLFKQ